MAYQISTRPSTADVIFAQLRQEIMAVKILPGAKLSEAEVASKFGVSRQPVREALNLLSGEGLVEIKPQRATRVRRFSLQEIAAARFARRALEIEVIKRACELWSDARSSEFVSCLDAQRQACAESDVALFHALDEDFHALIAETAQIPFAFEQIKSHKAYIDRICLLSLKKNDEMATLADDHQQLYDCLSQRDQIGAEAVLRVHLARITSTIEAVCQERSEYFEA
ncbi:MAG: GntR family transcriptional regulator [Pseudomonadota bacterium]